jgi:hypothetical protein
MAKRKKENRTPVSAPQTAAAARRPLLFGAAAVASVLVAVGVLGFVLLSGDGDSGDVERNPALTAVIVDQLQLTAPNPDFVSETRGLLAEAGYTVDYIAGENVTVDYYRTLPTKDYDLVLLRVHAGITTEVDADTGEKTGTEYVSLFTGEPYDEAKYPSEQMNRLGKATYDSGGDPLFGIGPEFVNRSMEGDFGGALVVMMGCDGLRSQTTAEAFLDRGAGAFVSWSKPVSAPHTDEATDKFLRYYLQEGASIESAVEQTAAELGPDPTYDGELRVLTHDT